MDIDARVKALKTYRAVAAQCERCRAAGLIHRESDGQWASPLFQEGTDASSGVLVVAEAPNWDDTFKYGRLTYDSETDPTGRFARDLFASVGLSPTTILCTNAVLCLPTHRKGTFPVAAAQLTECRTWLERLIADVNPSVVVTFGGKALSGVGKIEKHDLTLKTGTGRLHSWFGQVLLPLYHPSRLGRVTRSADQQMEDIQVLGPFLREGRIV